MSEAKCVDHAEAPAAGTCLRCGNFLCADCALVGRCQACAARPDARPEPRGIGGWLILPMLSLFGLPLNALGEWVGLLLDIRKYELAKIIEHDPTWLVRSMVMPTVTTALATWAIYTLPGFFRKLRVTTVRMQWLYAGLLINNVIVIVVQSFDEKVELTPNLLQFIFPILWISYFRTSKRVQQTFIRP